MVKKYFTTIAGGIVMIPLIFSCANSTNNILIKRATAERAVDAAKDAMAEFSKCPTATTNYFDATTNYKQGLGYMSNQEYWEQAEVYFDKAIKAAEKAEEDASLCENK